MAELSLKHEDPETYIRFSTRNRTFGAPSVELKDPAAHAPITSVLSVDLRDPKNRQKMIAFMNEGSKVVILQRAVPRPKSFLGRLFNRKWRALHRRQKALKLQVENGL